MRKRTGRQNAGKRRRNAGFTMAEMLIAVLILLMVSAVVAGGVPAAGSAYYKAVDGANAQVLLSTAVTALRDELTTARDIEVENNTITYYNRDDGRRSRISKDGQSIIVTEYYESAVSGVPDAKLDRKLVSGKAATNRLALTYDSVSFDEAARLITVSGLRVSQAGKQSALLEQDIMIRVLAP